MLISINQELRLHIPSNAVDDVTLLSGIIDNSEKDFLREKLGAPLYSRLCEYYDGIDHVEFCNRVIDGSYTSDPWAELLLNAQRMVCNDALARFAYQQVISVNGSGINVVSGNDYGNADDRLLDKGVGGYKKEAAIACNNLLVLLEDWAKQPVSDAPVSESEPTVSESEAPVSEESSSDNADGESTPTSVISEIIELWMQSKYYYLHADLLIPTAAVLQHYLDIYENRDKFIRLLPDLRFIQDEYIEDTFGADFVREMLAIASGISTLSAECSNGTTLGSVPSSQAERSNGPSFRTLEPSSPESSFPLGGVPSSQPSNAMASPTPSEERLLRKVRRLITAYLEQRTTVLTIDKVRRQQAHDESISLKDQILAILREREESNTDNQPNPSNPTNSANQSNPSTGSYKNNKKGSKIFVSPLLY